MNMDRVERRLSSLVYAVERSRFFFFFQAEDGIRDIGVTGVQTCALPISTEEMLEIALRHGPHAACIVPEKREERTTEGGLDAAGQHNHLAPFVRSLGEANIRVSLFIEPDPRQVEAALRLGVPVVELHTGRYAHVEGEERAA